MSMLAYQYTEVRPWGRFERLTLNEETTVKIITVEPGSRLSLQRHYQRDEYWQMLDDELMVEIDDMIVTTVTGMQFYIPADTWHRIGNPTDKPARFLEIAFGEFDEQDIERAEDDFGRIEKDSD